jgi:16S rRNA (uracil1498-N3)-methyltransferase
MIRLFVDAPLVAGAIIGASAAQAHYLGTVMRRSHDDVVALFNGKDGEWDAAITAVGRGKASFHVGERRRPQQDEPDIWLVFALLKRDATDLVIEKATELGASAILPVLTERTNASRVNEDRLRAIATEAAEQCERLTIPTLHAPRPLHEILQNWPTERPLFVAWERASVGADPAVMAPLGCPLGLLVGPEGGFGPRDTARLRQHGFVRPLSLGPRILRAETAVIAGLTLLQAPLWR